MSDIAETMEVMLAEVEAKIEAVTEQRKVFDEERKQATALLATLRTDRARLCKALGKPVRAENGDATGTVGQTVSDGEDVAE